jgi:hypothetical protein
MNTPTAPTIRRLLGNLVPFLFLLAIALLLFALASWMETPASVNFQLLGWLQGLEHSSAADTMANAAEVVAGVLAIVITVAAIVVELAANRYTHRITQLFIREPVNLAVRSLFVLTAILCLWLSAMPELSVAGLPRFPRAGLVLGLALTTLCLLTLLPYFGFLFRFLAPTNVIARIRGEAIRLVKRARTRTVPGTRAGVIEAIEELEDVARSAREQNDRSISMAATSALAALRTLDVSILHRLILEQYLGITAQAQEAQSNLRYCKGFSEPFAQVDRGEGQLAFLLNPTRMSEVRDVANAGEKMPQKSTYFYPKLLSGLVINPHI